MTEQEAREIMRACGGWSLLKKPRKGHLYVYAARHLRTGREEIYIGSLASLERITSQELKQKLSCA